MRKIRDNGPEFPDQQEAEITKAIFMWQIDRQVREVDKSKWKASNIVSTGTKTGRIFLRSNIRLRVDTQT